MKVLIIDKMHESIHALLKDAGVIPDYRPDIGRSEILQIIPQYQGLIVRSKTLIDRELLRLAKQLKFVARAGAGIDNVDLETMQENGITLLNAPEGNRDALAEHCVGLMLNLLNKINLADREVRAGIWDREGNRGVELRGKTIGLLGFGYMGQAFAEKLQGFGVEILVHDIEKTGFSTQYVQEVSLEELQLRSEILSIHISLNAQNKGLINKQFISNFNKLSYIINTSRGEVLVLADLVALLTNGTLKGAALDVLENEKISDLAGKEQSTFETLINLPQVILTPHVAGWTFESYYKINEILALKIKKMIDSL